MVVGLGHVGNYGSRNADGDGASVSDDLIILEQQLVCIIRGGGNINYALTSAHPRFRRL